MNLPDISTKYNATGAKESGEFGCIGATAAFTNAAAGPRAVDMPTTPGRPWRPVRAK